MIVTSGSVCSVTLRRLQRPAEKLLLLWIAGRDENKKKPPDRRIYPAASIMVGDTRLELVTSCMSSDVKGI